MSTLRVIKTEDQHLQYLRRVEELIAAGGSISAAELAELELLTVIIESYENSRYPLDPVDPIEAIKFRMHEKGLKQSDLIQFFGSSGRVSEVLSRKRPLTVAMIRSLSQGLGISADVLIGANDEPDGGVDWSKFPVKEIISRGWIGEIAGQNRQVATKRIEEFITASGIDFQAASFRRTLSGNANSPTSTLALYAWLARVIQQARLKKADVSTYQSETINQEFLRELAHLSWFETGPALAVEFLQKNGVCVVIEPHLKGTHLDGAALKDTDGTPVIALTLRYDRLDYFWFTLLHEMAHIWRHPFDDSVAYVDDVSRDGEDKREAEANKIAAESFIPRLIWRRSEAYLNPSRRSVEELAFKLRVHPAVIAGRIQRERGDYSLLRDLLGQGEVKKTLGV